METHQSHKTIKEGDDAIEKLQVVLKVEHDNWLNHSHTKAILGVIEKTARDYQDAATNLVELASIDECQLKTVLAKAKALKEILDYVKNTQNIVNSITGKR